MVKHARTRGIRNRSTAVLAALAALALTLTGAQPALAGQTSAQPSAASAMHIARFATAATTDSQDAGGSFEISNSALVDAPQLFLSGKVSVVELDMQENSTTLYSVLTDAGTVRIDGDLGRLQGGGTFSGTVALPAALTNKLSRSSASRVQDSADSPISVREYAGAQLVELAQSESEPLQVVSANIVQSQAPLGTAAHTVDVAVLNGASFSDSTVNTQVSDLASFWDGQSNGAITGVTRPASVQRYPSAYLNDCKTTSNWVNEVWTEAAAKFGKSVSTYYSTSGLHLVVFADMPIGKYCSEGIGSVAGGSNGGGVIVANIDVVTRHTFAHEFGHNLGLGHANVHECDSPTLVEGTTAQGCYDTEYDDYYDVMSGGFIYPGIGNTNQLAALNVTDRIRLGFLPSSDLDVVTGSGDTVSLAPASDTTGLRGVQVVDPLTSSTYYVEYRSGTGMDTGAFYTKTFPSSSGETLGSLRPGVRILKMRGNSAGDDSVVLAQLKQPGDPYKMLAMKSGDVFTTPSGGLSVDFTGVSSGKAQLTIGIHTLPTMHRIAGANRYATAVEVSKAAYPTPGAGIPVVYVAQGADYPDALGAAPAAVEEGGPLLLTDSNSLTPIVKTEIERLNPAKIVVVGGAGVVKPAVFSALEALAPGNTIRLGGADRYETARLVVRHAFLDNGGPGAATAYIATGSGFPDALSASAAAGAEGIPVVLVNGSLSSLDSATKTLLQDLGVTQTWIAGGTGVVSTGVQNSLAAVSTVTRYAGSDRFDTSHKVNSAIFSSAPLVYLATGFQFPDALAGAAIAGSKGAPLYLVQTACIPAQIRSDIVNGDAGDAWLIGGTGVLTSRVYSFTSC